MCGAIKIPGLPSVFLSEVLIMVFFQRQFFHVKFSSSLGQPEQPFVLETWPGLSF